jgi:signal transduction histidine kinase
MQFTKLKILALIFCSFIFQNSYAQKTAQIDSIIRKLPYIDDSLKLDSYFELANMIWEADYKKSLEYCYIALELSKKNGYVAGEAKANEIIGMLKLDEVNYAEALRYLLRSYSIRKTYNLPREYSAGTLITMAEIFKYYGYNQISLGFADTALNIMKNLKPIEKNIYIFNQLTSYYLEENKLDIARMMFLKISSEFADSVIIAPQEMSRLYNEALYYEKINDIKMAKIRIKQAMKKADDSLKVYNGMYMLCENFHALLLKKENKYDSSISVLKYLLKHKINNILPKWTAINLRELAEIYFLINDYKNAEIYGYKSLQISIKEQFNEDIRKAYLLLSQISEKNKEYKNQAFYSIKYSQLSDSISFKERSAIIMNVYLQNELDETLFMNSKLSNENIKKTSIIKDKQILQLILILVSCAVFIFTIVIIYFFVQYRITNDILKKQSEEILEKNNQLESQNQLLTELNEEVNGIVGIVSHDLKAPINRIESFLKFVGMDKNLSLEQQDFVKRALLEVDNSKSMIKKILETESTSDDVKLFYNEVNIHELLTEIFEKYRLIGGNKLITIHLQNKITSQFIKTDKEQLIRILDNLLSNAIKFSSRNKNIYLNAYQTKNRVVLEVLDEGPGISLSDRKNLFKKYQKLSAKPTEDESSTGLGLYIVKKIVHRLGGEIEVLDNKPQGAIFRVII